MDPRVTIGVPVYNGERFLDAALRSLRGQTFEDIEIIVADNASTDGTADIARAHADADPRVRYLGSDQNLGAARNFNRLVELASGEYFKWAADDDICLPTYLERCVEVLDSRPDVVWCQSRVGLVDPDDVDLPVGPASDGRGMSYVEADPDRGESPTSPTRGDAEPHRRLRAILLETVGDGNWDVFGLIRREVLAATGLQRPHYGADKVFVAELALQGRFAEVPEPLFLGRLHERASGALDTIEAQRAWIDPSGRQRFAMTRSRLLGAYVQAVATSGLSVAERRRCLGAVAGYAFQLSKWKRVVSTTVRGQGTGGGYVPYLESPTGSEQEGREAT